jgi:hypothetical protein
VMAYEHTFSHHDEDHPKGQPAPHDDFRTAPKTAEAKK